MVLRDGLGIGHIEPSAPDDPRTERLGEGIGIDDGPSRHIDEAGRVLHPRELLGPDQADGLVGEAHTDHDMIRPIEEIKAEVERLCGGKPQPPRLTDRPVATINWVDGTVIDTVYQVED